MLRKYRSAITAALREQEMLGFALMPHVVLLCQHTLPVCIKRGNDQL